MHKFRLGKGARLLYNINVSDWDRVEALRPHHSEHQHDDEGRGNVPHDFLRHYAGLQEYQHTPINITFLSFMMNQTNF